MPTVRSLVRAARALAAAALCTAGLVAPPARAVADEPPAGFTALVNGKDLSGWRGTVRRMAARPNADIPNEDIEPISVYLASRNATAADGSSKIDGSTASKESSSPVASGSMS